MLFAPCHEIFDLSGGWTAAVVAEAEAKCYVDAFTVFNALQCAIEFGNDGRAFATIPV